MTITYNEGIEIIDNLLNTLDKKQEIPKLKQVEYNILHDCLTSYKNDLINEMERLDLVNKFNNFNPKKVKNNDKNQNV